MGSLVSIFAASAQSWLHILLLYMILQGWRTKSQLLVLHGGNVELVEAIVASKKALGMFRPHPDAPDDPEAMLFYVDCSTAFYTA